MTALTEWLKKVQDSEEQDPVVLKERTIEVLKQIFDPELPVNIYDLGLIYDIECGRDGVIDIKMTLTSPGCPVAQTFPGIVETRVTEEVEGAIAAQVELVWEPPWTRELLSEEVRLDLGLM